MSNCVNKKTNATFALYKKGSLELEKQIVKTSDLQKNVLTKIKLNSGHDNDSLNVSYSYTECEMESSKSNGSTLSKKKIKEEIK